MNIVIMGGTGLIGRALSACLAGAGHGVVVLSRNPARYAGHMPGAVSLLAWDGRGTKGWAEVAECADVIVNLAGASLAGEGLIPRRWTPARKRLIRDSRLEAARAVTGALRMGGRPRVLIQASAIGYYGFGDDREVDEDSPPGKGFLAELATEWEAATDAVEEWGVRRVLIRTGVVLSRQGGALPAMALPFRLFAGGPMGHGRQVLSWIHVDDEVAAIRHLIERDDLCGPFNLTAPNPVSNNGFASELGRAMGRPAFLRAPAPVLRLALGEAADLVLRGRRVVPRRLLESGFEFSYSCLEGALKNLYRDG